MGSLFDKRRRRALRSRTALVPSTGGAPAGTAHGIRFVPARWLVLVLGIARTVLAGGKLGKLGLAGLIWSVTPGALKVAAVGAFVAATIVVAGALAAIALLALQIS
jgi:hypothetical protein